MLPQQELQVWSLVREPVTICCEVWPKKIKLKEISFWKMQISTFPVGLLMSSGNLEIIWLHKDKKYLQASSSRWQSRRTCAHLLLWEDQNCNHLLNNNWQEEAETQNRDPTPKDKKPQWDGRRDVITIKSDPTPARWVTHKLENNNTKEVLPLLWRFWTFPAWGSDKGTGSPQGIWPWRPVGFDYRTSSN